MRYLAFALVLVGVCGGACTGCDPGSHGHWSGKRKSIAFGDNAHHPGSQTVASPPRVRDFEFTFVVDGQDGRLAWVTRSDRCYHQRAVRLGYFGR